MAKKGKTGSMWTGIFGAMALALTLAGCASMSQSGKDADADKSDAAAPAVAGDASSEPSKGGRKFEEPGELDKMLDAKPMALAAVKPAIQAAPAAPATAAKAPEMAAPGKGKFRIQIGAESDVDAAQAKKAAYQNQLGGTVDVVFDAPYYKLRWGYFDSKQDAEDKLLELSDLKIQGFVVKQ
jgi:septal ring-binding cell division protein DamX